MATTYTRFIWPPLIFPVAVFIGRVGGTFDIGARPPMNLPLPLAARTSLATLGAVAIPTAPPRVLPSPASSGSVNFTPAAPPATPNTTSGNNTLVLTEPGKYVVADGVRRATNNLFKIISPTPGSGSGS